MRRAGVVVAADKVREVQCTITLAEDPALAHVHRLVTGHLPHPESEDGVLHLKLRKAKEALPHKVKVT